THLVSLPVAHSFQEFVGQLRLPNFSGFTNPKVWGLGATIAAVASIETLLCIEATDKMDAQKRYTPTNRELIAQGVGNMLSGFVGGLPMTSVIVRSSANVNAGATSKLSTVIHGVLLLACAASIPALLNLIPKASLAAILIFTGYKLCKPKMFVEMWKSGINRFIPFAVTAIAVPIIGLLDGVALGGAISIIFLLRENYRLPFSYRRSSFTAGELIKIDLAQVVTFLNKAGIKETLYKLPENSSVIIDAGKSEYIDRDALDIIREFSQSVAKDRNIKLSLVGFKEQYNLPKSLSEADVIAHFIDIDEVPALSSGNHKDLMQNLSINN
ncbi:MAG: SulP family inorganic anion transporter, partial [Chitinophagia bacterium]|nr:SulP family inorganic anion transporter [Chitinophagia bacterium]